MAENRTFGMHPNLLFDVILRQAGTLQKAILEGVMNAIDAGATQCAVTLDTHHFSIEDDGRGFQSKQEIEAFFETFGTPHEEGDATYGRFRMGRGQMMAFGPNIWRSRQFEMHVDIKTKGLDYTLIEHKSIHQGTTISATLYDPMLPSDLERTKNELRRFVAYAQIPITLNGEVISTQPAMSKWTHEDEDAYYALSADRSQLSVYNLGVLVNQFYAGRFGMGGTIVTKKQIEVNFARNDVQSSCPVFKRIQNTIKKMSGQAAKKKTKLTEAERDLLASEFLSGNVDIKEAGKLRILTDVKGRTWPLNKLNQISGQFGGNLLVAKRGDQMAETAQHRGIAFAIDEATLERFGTTHPQAFLERVAQAAGNIAKGNEHCYDPAIRSVILLSTNLLKDVTVVDRAYLTTFVDEHHIALKASDLTADEKILLSTINSANSTLVCALNNTRYEEQQFAVRRLHLGRSQTALAWTDGTQNIWIDVEHARLLRKGYRGAYQVALTLLHEMLHTGPDSGTHEHDHAFYQAFHDLSGSGVDPVGRTADRMVATFIAQLRQKKKKISAKLLERDDVEQHIEKIQQETVQA